jgi:hypothetical protein
MNKEVKAKGKEKNKKERKLKEMKYGRKGNVRI